MFDELMMYCLAKPGAWRDEPWEGTIVAKVDRKIFAFVAGQTLGVKCGMDRDEADEWMLRHPDDSTVMAYIGRNGWNTLRTDGGIPLRELREAVDDSYLMVVSRLPKSHRPAGWDG